MNKYETQKLQADRDGAVSELLRRRAEHAAALSKLGSDHDNAVARAQEMEKANIVLRDTIHDLKKLLHDSELENARLRGYLARVYEADDSKSDYVNVPHDVTPMLRTQVGRADLGAPVSSSVDSNGFGYPREKQKHWTSF